MSTDDSPRALYWRWAEIITGIAALVAFMLAAVPGQ